MANQRSTQVKVEDKLRSMKGRTYQYNTMNVQILSWKYETEYCTVVTSGPWVTRKIDEMLKFIDESFLEVEEDEVASENKPAVTSDDPVLMPNLKGLAKCDDLLDILMSNIDMVSKNKDYTEQAGKVEGLVGKVISITKVQLDAFRFANELHRNR